MSIELRRARSRQMLIFLLVCVGMLILLGRLYYWQVVRGDELAKQASSEHIQNQILIAPRGLIYDAQGHILATNVVRDDVYIEPIQFSLDHSPDTFQSDLAKLVDALHRILPAVSQEKLYKDFNLNAWTVRIASRIEPWQSQQLRSVQLPDTFLQPLTWRIYPGGMLVSQILGFVRQDDKNSAGIYGIERQYGSYANQTGCVGKESVFLNPALYCAYEPGSTMKAVTMAAALDQGLITPDTSFYDPGYMVFDDAAMVTNWQGLAYGTETMTQVLEHSANVGAAYVAHNILGPKRYYPYLTRFGFGQATGIGGQEEIGSFRTPGNDPQGWSPSDLTRQAFGQSILATPLQVAMAYETIANGGLMMRPYLVASINNNGRVVTIQPQVERRVISTHTAQILAGMLMHVASEGLAQPAKVPGYTVAAKTGTATTQGISEFLTEASVAGFIPASNPQFVILVKIDRAKTTIYGGTAAGPLWKAIAQQLMWYYHVPPDEQA